METLKHSLAVVLEVKAQVLVANAQMRALCEQRLGLGAGAPAPEGWWEAWLSTEQAGSSTAEIAPLRVPGAGMEAGVWTVAVWCDDARWLQHLWEHHPKPNSRTQLESLKISLRLDRPATGSWMLSHLPATQDAKHCASLMKSAGAVARDWAFPVLWQRHPVSSHGAREEALRRGHWPALVELYDSKVLDPQASYDAWSAWLKSGKVPPEAWADRWESLWKEHIRSCPAQWAGLDYQDSLWKSAWESGSSDMARWAATPWRHLIAKRGWMTRPGAVPLTVSGPGRKAW